MTATTRAAMSRWSWRLTCRRCGDLVVLCMPRDYDAKVWSSFVDSWGDAHGTSASPRGDVDIVAATPDARMPWDLEVRPCR